MSNEQLVACIQAGIDVAENMLLLWERNQGMIGKIASRYAGYENIEDLKQQGYIGLYDAVQGYRAEEGSKFITYAAFWIRQSIQRYLQKCGSVIRLPAHARDKVLRYRRFCVAFEKEVGRAPNDQEICWYMDCNINSLHQMQKDALMGQVASLDAPISGYEDEELTVSDTVAGEDNPEEEVVLQACREQLQATIWPLVDALPDNCPEVIRMRYQGGASMQEIGRKIGRSQSEARQLERKAMQRLRRPGTIGKLRPFLDEKAEAQAYLGGGIATFNRTWTSSTERVAMKL